MQETEWLLSAYVNFGLIGKSCKSFVQGLVHFFGSSFEEATAAWEECQFVDYYEWELSPLTADEQGISGEDDLFVAIFQKVADVVLGVARSV
jgi:hypothetical protein